MVLDNVILRDSEATNSGGALYLEVRGGSSLEIRNSQFLRNTAAAGGGLDLHVYDDSTVVIADTLFDGNSASAGVGGGGRIVLHSGTVKIAGTTFTNNQASVAGGALAIVSAGTGVVDLYPGTYSNNTAPIGRNIVIQGAGITLLTSHLYLPMIGGSAQVEASASGIQEERWALTAAVQSTPLSLCEVA